MTNKRIYTYGLIVLLIVVNLGLFDKNRSINEEIIRDNSPVFGNSSFTGPSFFKISSSSIQNINNRDFFIGDGTSSVSANASVSFAVDSITQNIRFGGFATCNLDTDGDGDLVCGTDSGGSGVGFIRARNSGGTFVGISSISFDAGHFTFSNTASEGYLRLDWDSAGGPASLSQAETIAGNWVNTANPWANDEVADNLTIDGGTVTWTDLTTYPGACSAGQFVSTIGDTITCGTPSSSTTVGFIRARNSYGTFVGISSISFDAGHFTFSNTASQGFLNLDWGSGGPASLSEAETIAGNWVNTANPWADNEVIDALTVSGGTIGANNISGTQTTTGTTTFGDNGDSIIFDASNWDISTLGKADFLSASVSTNFEAVGYASASSLFVGTGKQFQFAITQASVSIPLEIANTASATRFIQTGTTASNTFQGSLNIAKSLTVTNTLNATGIDNLGNYRGVGTASSSFDGSLNITKSLTVTQSITGLLKIIGTTLQAITNLIFPTYTGTSITGTANSAIHTTSSSLDFNDGTNTKVLDGRSCFSYEVGAPTAANPSYVGRKRFDNPFTIDSVQMVASGSNAAGWNLVYYRPGGALTRVFTNHKSASTSASPTYSANNTYTMNNSTISDGMVLSAVITSRSATLEGFSITVCGRQNH